MAKTKRGKDKKIISHAHAGITRAIVHLARLEKKFSRHHKDYAEYLQMMCILLEQVQDMIDDFCDKAWGAHPSDYEVWRNVKRRDDPDEYPTE